MSGFIDHAERVVEGDMIDLEGDGYADPHCEVGCVFRSQNAEVVGKPEYVDGGSRVRVVFHTDPGTGDGLERHVFTFPRHHELTYA